MNRHVHLWFFFGILMALGTFAAVCAVAAFTAGMDTTGKIAVFASLEVLVIGFAVWHVKAWARLKARMHERVSRELTCAEARRLRLRQRIARVGV